MGMDVERALHAYDDEKRIIACIAYDPDLLLAYDIPPEAFELETYRKCWLKAHKDWDRGIATAPSDYGDIIGDVVEWTEVLNYTPSTAYMGTYVDAVLTAYRRRKAKAYSEKIAAVAYDHTKDPDAAKDIATTFILDEDGPDASTTDAGNIDDVIEDIILRSEQDTGAWKWPIPGMEDVNDIEPGMLVYFAAPDGTGKTTWAENVGEAYAQQGASVGFFHFELNKRVMVQRMAARNLGVEVKRNLTAADKDMLRNLRSHVDAWAGDYKLHHCPGWTVEQVIRKTEVMGHDLIVLDYMQKIGDSRYMDGKDDLRSQAQKLEAIKNWAERREIRVIILGQITKNGKDGVEPQIKDIRGSGEITDKSNFVLMGWREIVDVPKMRPDGTVLAPAGTLEPVMNIKVVKNTMGAPLAPFRLALNGPRFLLTSPDNLKRVQLKAA